MRPAITYSSFSTRSAILPIVLLALMSGARSTRVGGAMDFEAHFIETIAAPQLTIHKDYFSNEHSLEGGRLDKIPVSWAFHRVFTFPKGQDDYHFRAVCSSDDTSCDPAMIVTKYSGGVFVRAYFNDNGLPPGDKNGANLSGSWINAGPPQRATTTFHVYVFSQIRQTSSVEVSYKKASDPLYTSAGHHQVGGALIGVGPLLANDFLEVQTRSKGKADFRTAMLLFNDGAPNVKPVHAEQTLACIGGNCDYDPRVNIKATDWTSNSAANRVLVYKVGKHTSSNTGTEIFADLVHGPVDQRFTVALGGSCGTDTGCSLELRPGSYYAYLRASITNPPGNGAGLNSSAMNNAEGVSDCAENQVRGNGNSDALTIQLEKRNGNSWVVVKSRTVPAGAFGTESDFSPTNRWQRFTIPFENPDSSASYRLVITTKRSDVSHSGAWHAVRNPEVNQVGMVTANMLFKDPDEHHDVAKFRNAANLFTGGNAFIYKQTNEVKAIANRQLGGFQWDADVVAMQEVSSTGQCGQSDPVAFVDGWTLNGSEWKRIWLARYFLNEAQVISSPRWSWTWGHAENWSEYPCFWSDNRPPMATIHVQDNVWPDHEDKYSISPDLSYLASCGAKGNWSGSSDDKNKGFCQISYTSDIWGFREHSFIAAKVLKSRISGGPNRPVVVYNIHLHSESDSERLEAITNLITQVRAMIDHEPCAFSKNCPTGPQNWQDESIRFIVIGDANMRAHECGEHLWLLNRLRDAFGYAVDVALAMPASHRFGMHDKDNAFMAGIPLGFKSISNFKDAPLWTGPSDPAQDFPWWASTIRRKHVDSANPVAGGTYTSSRAYEERNDVIWLVGRGWASDDPVLDYETLWDSHNPNTPMSKFSDKCVELFFKYKLVGPSPTGGVAGFYTLIGEDSCADDERSYWPKYNLVDGTINTRRGDPALNSDHRPVYSKLRLWEN